MGRYCQIERERPSSRGCRGLLMLSAADFRSGAIAPFWLSTEHFRSSPNSRHLSPSTLAPARCGLSAWASGRGTNPHAGRDTTLCTSLIAGATRAPCALRANATSSGPADGSLSGRGGDTRRAGQRNGYKLRQDHERVIPLQTNHGAANLPARNRRSGSPPKSRASHLGPVPLMLMI
jgi:hypothetical protein